MFFPIYMRSLRIKHGSLQFCLKHVLQGQAGAIFFSVSCDTPPLYLLKMLCSGCNTVRYSKEWTPAQYKNRDATAHGRRWCKVCDPNYMGCTREQALDTLQLLRLAIALTAEQKAYLFRFLDAWYDTLRYKPIWHQLRWIGSLYMRPEDEGQYDRLEDPGNLTYLIVMRLVIKEWLDSRWISNAVTAGDVMETIFGLAVARGTLWKIPFLRWLVGVTRAVRQLVPCLPSMAVSARTVFVLADLERHVRACQWAVLPCNRLCGA